MSLEVWGDEGDAADTFTEDAVYEYWRYGLRTAREMIARFVEPQSPEIAASIRANWHPGWGKDPGQLTDAEIPTDPWGL